MLYKWRRDRTCPIRANDARFRQNINEKIFIESALFFFRLRDYCPNEANILNCDVSNRKTKTITIQLFLCCPSTPPVWFSQINQIAAILIFIQCRLIFDCQWSYQMGLKLNNHRHVACIWNEHDICLRHFRFDFKLFYVLRWE